MAQVLIDGSSGGGKLSSLWMEILKLKAWKWTRSIAGDKSEVARHVRAALEDLFKNYKNKCRRSLGNAELTLN